MSAAAPEFDPTAIAGLPPKDHNHPKIDPFDEIAQEIADLYDEAKNFCDGEPISSQEMADAISELSDRLHACEKKADKLRTKLKKPLDDAVKALQARFHPLIGDTKAGKGKAVLGKEACLSLLTPWRAKVAAEKAAEAARVAAEAEAAKLVAQEAIRASAGNLADREVAEELLREAKALEKTAKRADKAATTGTGLRSVWCAEIADEEAALNWAYELAPGEFMALALSLANEQVRLGKRELPGFVVREERAAAVRRAA